MIKSSFCVYLFGLEALAQQRGFSFFSVLRNSYCVVRIASCELRNTLHAIRMTQKNGFFTILAAMAIRATAPSRWHGFYNGF